MSDTLRARIAAALADEFEGQAQKFDDASWGDVADVVIAELGLTQEFVVRHESGGGRITSDRQEAERRHRTFVERLPGVEDPGSGKLTGVECRYVTEWENDE